MRIIPLSGPRIVLRPAIPADAVRFTEITEQVEVKPWWREYNTDLDHLDPETGATADGEYVYAIEVNGVVIGLVQFLEETEPDYHCASIDIFLDQDWHGRGLGSEAIRSLARYLFDERGHHRITIDPAVANDKAVRSYESIGFKRVGVTRQSERGLDGTWHDSLLMDLLKDELS